MSNLCSKCKYGYKDGSKFPCKECSHNHVDYFRGVTNFDKIKAMSVSELASFICGIYDEDEDAAKFINGTRIPCYDQYSIEEWLTREVEE